MTKEEEIEKIILKRYKSLTLISEANFDSRLISRDYDDNEIVICFKDNYYENEIQQMDDYDQSLFFLDLLDKEEKRLRNIEVDERNDKIDKVLDD